jgi:hypothetical protein
LNLGGGYLVQVQCAASFLINLLNFKNLEIMKKIFSLLAFGLLSLAFFTPKSNADTAYVCCLSNSAKTDQIDPRWPE